MYGNPGEAAVHRGRTDIGDSHLGDTDKDQFVPESVLANGSCQHIRCRNHLHRLPSIVEIDPHETPAVNRNGSVTHGDAGNALG